MLSLLKNPILLCLTLLISSVAMSHAQGFSDATVEAGLIYTQQENIAYSTEEVIMTGGAAAGDFDGDGWIDLFVTRLNKTDILFRNTGGDNPGQPVSFEDVTAAAGITTVAFTNGAAWGDLDNDGDLDLYVTALRSDRFFLYVNNGDGTFTESAVALGADLTSTTDHSGYSVAMGDYNRDGWIDLFTSEWGISENITDLPNHGSLLRNMGANNPGHFTNETTTAGIVLDSNNSTDGRKIYGFSSRFSDLDNDGWPDLLIVSDFRTNQLYWNSGNGKFTDGTAAAGLDGPANVNNAMGSAIGDFNGDGLLDLFLTSVHDNQLYRNKGDRSFQPVPFSTDDTENWGWGTEFFDYDNDGDLDLIMTNGIEDYANSIPPLLGDAPFSQDTSRLWQNEFGNFIDVSEQEGINDILNGKGLLTFDYDNDGDIDVFIANTASRPILYRNENKNTNKWLRVSLIGTLSNPHGLGAKLYLTTNGIEQFREMTGGSPYLSQSEMVVHFGMSPTVETIDSLRIEWPNGSSQTYEDIAPNQLLKVTDLLTYDSWKRLQFTTAQLNDAQTSDEDRDPDADSLSNFFEYFADSSPVIENANPITGRITETTPGNYTFYYKRPTLRNGIRVIYETSPDLSQENWTTLGNSSTSFEMRTPLNSTHEQVEIPVTHNTQENGSLFIRLRLEELN